MFYKEKSLFSTYFKFYLGGNNFQNIAMALQQASQQQNGFLLGVNSNSNNSNQDNDGGQNQQTSDLSLLAQLASNRNNQDNQNR